MCAQAFIGQKYGPRPLPTSIIADEYEVIRVALHAHRGRDTRNAPLLDQSYVIDTNSLPPVYVLRAASEIIPELQHVSRFSSTLALMIGNRPGGLGMEGKKTRTTSYFLPSIHHSASQLPDIIVLFDWA